MKRKCRIARLVGWILSFALVICCLQGFEITDVKAAGSILTSSDGLWQYEYVEESSGETVVVVDDYNGSDRDLVIPEEIDGYVVRYIGKPSGWYTVNTGRFDSITISDSVTGLKNVPFFTNSHNLKFLYLGKNYGTYSQYGADINMIKANSTYDIQAKEYRVSPENKVITAVDGVLYSKDMTELKLYPSLKEDAAFTVPDGVTSIANDAMNNLQYLESLVLPEGLKEIGTYCFRDSSIRSVCFPDSLTSLTAGLFYQSKLESVVLPKTITAIGGYVFTGTPLKEIVIPDTIVSLGAGSFMNCDKLKSIRIGSGLASIGGNCFYGLTALETFEISEENPNFKSEEGMLLTKDGSTLIQYAAAGNTEFILPDGVTVIGDNACYEMPFNKIVIPDTVVTIGSNAFTNCTEAETAYVPSSVTSLGDSVFSGCTSLKTVTIDAQVARIGSGFSNCNALTEITLPETVTSVGDQIFFGNSLRSVYLKSPQAPSISYTIYIQGQDAQTEMIKRSSNVRVFVPEDAQGYDVLPWSQMHIVYGDTIAPERLTLDPSSVILNVGEKVTLRTLVSPEDAVVQDAVWETSDKEIASVDENGQVVALSAGTARIKVTAGGLSNECIVTVRGDQQAQDFRVETSGGVASSNYNAQNYAKWSSPMKSYLFEDGEGGLMRAEFISGRLVYETYGMDGTLKESGSITDELPLAGGFYVSGTNRFIVYGQSNSGGSDSTEVMRIVKYDQDWNRVASCSLYGENTKVPFDAGSLRFAEYEDTLYIRTSHTMYNGHQSNLQAAIDMSSMEITDTFSVVANIDYGGYVSHSFNQFLQMDGEDLITLDHGDCYPRAAVLIRYPDIKETTFARASLEYVNALEFPGLAGDNVTGASLGGFEVSEDYYIFAGNYANDSSSSVRNIFVNITDKDLLRNPDTRMIYLTDFDADSGVTVSTPQLVKVNEKTFLVLWNETDASGITVHSQMIDEEGNRVTGEQSFHGSISDCQPIIQDGQAVWYYTGTKNGDTTPIFCRISVDGRETADNLLDGETEQEAGSGTENEGDTEAGSGTENEGDTEAGSGTEDEEDTKADSGTEDEEDTEEGGGKEEENTSDNSAGVSGGMVKVISSANVSLSQTLFAYDGSAKMPTVTVKDGNKTLVKDRDYTIIYKNNVNVGKATVTVTGKGDYIGRTTKYFRITVKSGTSHKISSCQYKVTGASAVSMTGVTDNKITNVKVPKTVNIGGKTFKVTSIGSSAFKNNKKITSIEIGDNVETIGASAFAGCTKLRKAALGTGVTEIGANAFKNCRKLGNVTIKAAGLKKVGKNALKGIKATAKIKVPKKKLSDYKKLFRNKGQSGKVKIKK